jgi:hypothetical protein
MIGASETAGLSAAYPDAIIGFPIRGISEAKK